MMKSRTKLNFLCSGILLFRYDWLNLILKISLGHKIVLSNSSKNQNEMLSGMRCWSFGYHTYYISVSPVLIYLWRTRFWLSSPIPRKLIFCVYFTLLRNKEQILHNSWLVERTL